MSCILSRHAYYISMIFFLPNLNLCENKKSIHMAVLTDGHVRRRNVNNVRSVASSGVELMAPEHSDVPQLAARGMVSCIYPIEMTTVSRVQEHFS